jgi:hypothetical protein
LSVEYLVFKSVLIIVKARGSKGLDTKTGDNLQLPARGFTQLSAKLHEFAPFMVSLTDPSALSTTVSLASTQVSCDKTQGLENGSATHVTGGLLQKFLFRSETQVSGTKLHLEDALTTHCSFLIQTLFTPVFGRQLTPIGQSALAVQALPFTIPPHVLTTLQGKVSLQVAPVTLQKPFVTVAGQSL